MIVWLVEIDSLAGIEGTVTEPRVIGEREIVAVIEMLEGANRALATERQEPETPETAALVAGRAMPGIVAVGAVTASAIAVCREDPAAQELLEAGLADTAAAALGPAVRVVPPAWAAVRGAAAVEGAAEADVDDVATTS